MAAYLPSFMSAFLVYKCPLITIYFLLEAKYALLACLFFTWKFPPNSLHGNHYYKTLPHRWFTSSKHSLLLFEFSYHSQGSFQHFCTYLLVHKCENKFQEWMQWVEFLGNTRMGIASFSRFWQVPPQNYYSCLYSLPLFSSTLYPNRCFVFSIEWVWDDIYIF